jgi:hypothetical protein
MKQLILKNTASPMTNIMVRVVEKGDGFGRHTPIAGFARCHDESEPLVEFYDLDIDRTPFGGQFVSRYYISSLLEKNSGGLCLDGGVPKWNINEPDMNDVRKFLELAAAEIDYEESCTIF